MKFFLLITICLTLPFVSGCGYRWEKGAQASAGGADLQIHQLSVAPSYAVVRAKVLASRCTVCHQASNPQNAGVLLDDYTSTKSHLADIQRTVFEDKSMPKGARLSADEASLLSAWLKAGGPLEAPVGSGETPGQPVQPPLKTAPEQFRWPRVQATVFARHCAGCHEYDAPGAREGADALIKRVLVKKDMPPREQGALTEEELEALAQWIRYGMQD